LSGVGLVMAALLAVARKAFAVEVDERQELIEEILPGANCGGCGFPGCSGYAAALVLGKAKPNACPPGGADLATELGEILGVEVEAAEDLVALVACAGDNDASPSRVSYLGVKTCTAAHSVAGGDKACAHGCLGLGDCEAACPFDAIVMADKGLALVIADLCTGCKNCVEACPRGIIKMVPRISAVHVLCTNPEKSKQVKAVCSVGCTGCKLCKKQSKAFVIDGSLAALDYDFEGEIAQSAALACAPGAIVDQRKYSQISWITDPTARQEYDKRSDEWKAAEKAAKAAKAAKKKAAAKKAAEAEVPPKPPAKADDGGQG
ncbi:MAG: RnfABCDGE type electron transport complex subunit B, partial [Deltaproteobacteria bacterium]|nr:RnfABCDGE type electron transport complex subunit B [Deltaproteobacteria bacterium]